MNTFRIEYKNWESLEKVFGDDTVHFHLEIYRNAEKDFSAPVIVPFHTLRYHYIQHTDAALYGYITKVSESIHSWGPCDSQIITELESSGIAFIPILKQYINTKYDLEKHWQHWKNISTPTEQKQAQKVFDDLSEGLPDIAASARQRKTFCTNIEKALTEEILKVYPIIFESNPEHILKLKSILSSNILRLAEDIGSLAYKAKCSNKEEERMNSGK